MRKWFGLIVALAGVLLLAVVVLALGHLALDVLNGVGMSAEPDPMFPEPVEAVRRPDELSEETALYEQTLDDPSSKWVYDELSPVYKTAAELAKENE